MERLRGTGVALITPFDDSGAIDFQSLERLVNHVIDGCVDYMVVLGTTSEAATMTNSEKQEVLSFVVKVNDGRVPIVVGIGGNNTVEVAQAICSCDLTGVSAILSVVPYYNKPNQTGIYQHFSYLAQYSPLPIILYNVPGRTGGNMAWTTTVKLANDFPDVFIGIKEASGNMNQISYIIKNKPADFIVISGDDNLTVPMIALGCEGVISVSANSIPREVSLCVGAALDNDFAKAQEFLCRLLEFQDAIFEEGNPTGIKSALTIQGLIQNNLRLPLTSSSETLDCKINKIMVDNGLL